MNEATTSLTRAVTALHFALPAALGTENGLPESRTLRPVQILMAPTD